MLNVIYSCDAKLEFQHHCISLHCHIIIMLKHGGNYDTFFSGFFDE